MKLKVCGLQDEDNIQGVLSLEPDFIGFIFYPKSKRYVEKLDPQFVRKISVVKKVGVFVNSTIDEVVAAVNTYGLDYVQLHGDEDLDFVRMLKSSELDVIKAFRVYDQLPEDLDEYAQYSAYFLFDTKCEGYGGSGRKFDWNILRDVSNPFLLSGGIETSDLPTIAALEFENLIGIDVNSQFESAPGMKDLKVLGELKNLL